MTFMFAKDGGKESTVWGFWFVEIKRLFSIAILKFVGKSREAIHSHAFNSYNWVLKGELHEHVLGEPGPRILKPSLKPYYIARDRFHKVDSVGNTYVLSLRGPWADTWFEVLPERGLVKLTHGRVEVK